MLWTCRCEINYRYLIEECESEGGRLLSPVTVSVNDVTLTKYTLNNSVSSPVEEDSLFRITLTAVNSVTRISKNIVATCEEDCEFDRVTEQPRHKDHQR